MVLEAFHYLGGLTLSGDTLPLLLSAALNSKPLIGDLIKGEGGRRGPSWVGKEGLEPCVQDPPVRTYTQVRSAVSPSNE